MYISKGAKEVIKKLKKNGFEAYVVGGAVRDNIIGLKPMDFDITTNALPDEILKIFEKEIKSISGIKHGTIGVYAKKEYIEITTFRKDISYIDYRHPSNVEFVNQLKIDVSRRDFTMNAVAYDNEYYDFFNGIDDIKNKLIRCVGDPDNRFKEDALRIIRAIRFSIVLGFDIEENTKKAIFNNKDLLIYPSKERINIELIKIFNMKNVGDYLFTYFDIFKIVLPFLNHKERVLDLFRKSNEINDENTNLYYCFNLLLCLYLGNNLNYDGMEQIIKKELYEIKCSKKTILTIKKIWDIICIYNDNISIIYILKDFNIYLINYAICFLYSINRISKERYINDCNILIKYRNKCHNLKMMNFNGNDVLEIKKINGKDVKNVLNKLLLLIIEDKLTNDYELIKKECKIILEAYNEET